MSKNLLTLLLGLLVSVGSFAADFSAHIITYARELPKGAPMLVRGQVCNASGHPIPVAKGFQGFTVSFTVKRADGRPITGCPKVAIKPSGSYSIETVPGNWVHEETARICYGNSPGEFLIEMVVSSTDAYQKVLGGSVKAWSGQIRSGEIRVMVAEPVGEDKAAYEVLGKRPLPPYPTADTASLIEKYPTSTYALYALLAKQAGFLPTENSLKPESLSLARKSALGVIDPKELEGQPIYGNVDATKSMKAIALYNKMLLAHPDFCFRYALDYWLGQAYYGIHDFKNARVFFEKCLDPSVPEPIRVVSQVYLGVLTEKKL